MTAMAALGFDPEDFDDSDNEVEIWGCNVDAYYVFKSMATQWRVGMAGATGLDYAAMPVVMDMIGVGRKNRPDVFESVRIMEEEALITWAEHKNDG